MSELQQLLQGLLDKGYVKPFAGKYLFTDKFYAELGGVQTTEESNLPALQQTAVPMKLDGKGKVDWPMVFMNFILEAKVPARLEDNRGNPYYCNKYSEPALKVFRKAIESGVDYGTLVKSVMLYYKSNVRYKKAIGNYFVQGDWRSDYEALVSSVQLGEEALHQHIKQEVSDGGRSQFKLG